MKNKKRNKVMLLLILLLGITIGFAALATTLKINGTANVNKNTWNVYWANVANITGVEATTPTIGNDEDGGVNTQVTWSVNLNLPGDYYEFTVDAVNAGSIDAMISDIEDTVSPTLPSYINYSVTYANGKAIAENQLLEKAKQGVNTIQTYKVRVEFLNTITPEQMDAIPEAGLSYEFTYGITYSQADENAVSLKQKSVGEEVCFGTECFYVISSNSKTTSLLAKYNLNVGDNKDTTKTEGIQANTGYYDVPFSKVIYWSVPYPQEEDHGSYVAYVPLKYTDNNEIGISTGTFELIEDESNYYPYVYDEDYNGTPGTNTYSLAYYIIPYVNKLKNDYNAPASTMGRLIKDTESVALGCNIYDISEYTCDATAPAWLHDREYWTGTAETEENLYSFYVYDNDYLDFYNSQYSRALGGVRPVIDIPTSDLPE